jgi:tagatose 6-phosphate kinase
MILVFAPNPALERVALVDQFQPAPQPQKPMRVSTFAGGSGLRAATVIRLLGGDVLATGFVGGHLGGLLRDSLDRQDVPHVLTHIAADTRGDFLVLDKEKGVVTDIPESAPRFTPEEADKLLHSLRRHIASASLLLVADGPDENDDAQSEVVADLFARALAVAKEANVPVLADVYGPAFEGAVEAGAWLLRINYKALQKRTERSLQHDSAIIKEAQALLERGVGNVVVTLSEEGALLVNADGAWRVKAPIVSHFNPTGSGETLSGALAVHYEKTHDLLDAVRYGCAAASVNVTHDEPGYATPGEVGVLYPRTVVGPVIVR